MIPITDMTIHHIGYLVKNIDKATSEFQKLGYSIIKEKCYDDYRKVDITFLRKNEYCVELVSPTADDSVVSGLMSRFKNSPYHICYEVDDLEAAASDIMNNGFTAMDTPTPAPAIDGHRVQFFMNRFMGMIELVEK